ncbi:MAG TPA: hemerythrin domain-containing protein [Pseudonocardiaceae bacterium]|nr:hemerythrin domain-containing protein [Pseudonocardiaceae bacterium]
MPHASALDEADRPRRPRRADSTATESGLVGQRTLVAVHQHLRAELARIQEVVEQVAEHGLDPERARDLVNRTTMRQNYWTLGAFCASYCRVVSVHHTIEDVALFPTLRAADDTLEPVLTRLGEEHEVIAGLLDSLDRVLVELIAGRARPGDVRAATDELAATLLSHLAYEEEELLDPIGEFSIVV